jgi:hypothetical protein
VFGCLARNDFVERHEVLVELALRFLPVFVFDVFGGSHPFCCSLLALGLKDAVLSPGFCMLVDAEVFLCCQTKTQKLSCVWFLLLSPLKQGFELDQGLLHFAYSSGAINELS